jgi:hypothetical protein
MTAAGSSKQPGKRTAASEIDARYRSVVKAFAKDGGVTSGGKGFGSTALKVNGRIFAMLSSRQEFVVKLPKDRVDELVRGGKGSYFDPGHGRLMKEWVVIPFDAAATWTALAREARGLM